MKFTYTIEHFGYSGKCEVQADSRKDLDKQMDYRGDYKVVDVRLNVTPLTFCESMAAEIVVAKKKTTLEKYMAKLIRVGFSPQAIAWALQKKLMIEHGKPYTVDVGTGGLPFRPYYTWR